MGRKKGKPRSTEEKLVKSLKNSGNLGMPYYPKMEDGSGKQVCPFCLEVIPGSSNARHQHNLKHNERRETLKTEEAFKIAKGKK